MRRAFAVTMLVLVISLAGTVLAQSSPAYPNPENASDTILIFAVPADSGPIDCLGGSSLFVRQYDGHIPEPYLFVSMIDWVQIDDDNDGSFDEDPEDSIDNDLDGIVDEDPPETGAETLALDCDTSGDGAMTLQIRDADPRPGIVSTQSWFMRLAGAPGQSLAVTSQAGQTVNCISPSDAAVMVDTEAGCSSQWLYLNDFNLSADGSVQQVRLKGKRQGEPTGRSRPSDLTTGFEVDLITDDTNHDGTIDGDDTPSMMDTSRSVFTIACVDEALSCPLSNLLWNIDPSSPASPPMAQVVVSHSGASSAKNGRTVEP